MDQVHKAQAFAALHQKGRPLVLYNVWDAGSAKAVADAGAPAVATGSWAVAAAQGFGDGEVMPLQDLLRVVRQIVGAVAAPVSVDFEGGYALAPQDVARNVAGLMAAGAIGLNFEDRSVGGSGLHRIDVQAARIAAIRAVADAKGLPLFINARTDVFFEGSRAAPEDLMQQVIARAAAYGQAGADGLFVPGLGDLESIAHLCGAVDLPVNVMRMGEAPAVGDLAQAGVARISHGPGPYLAAMEALGRAAGAVI